eukprot:251204_1
METAEKSLLLGSRQQKQSKNGFTVKNLLLVVVTLIIIITIGIIVYFTLFHETHSKTKTKFERYEYVFNRTYINASFNNTKIAISLATPIPKHENEKFPVIFEYNPYRKDGWTWFRDWEVYDYFAKYGFIVCRADARGTGSSDGIRISHEYSENELIDAEYIIEWLATNYSYSNGNIGIWGKSWSAFNALILSMRQTQYLKSLFVFHGSDDLYYNDIHYINGILHIDEYIIEVDHDTTLPQSNYDGTPWIIDQKYIQERFDQPPWIIKYFTMQNDSSFWRNNSVGFHIDKLVDSNVSFYLWSGLLDQYRDYSWNLYSQIKNVSNETDIKIVISPYDHDYSSTASMRPRVEWKYEAVRWFNTFLRNDNDIYYEYNNRERQDDNNILDEDNVIVYVRDYYPPLINQTESPGEWRTYNTLPNVTDFKLYLTAQHELINNLEIGSDQIVHHLWYRSVIGTEVPIWWAGRTGNMFDLDQYSLVYDSVILAETLEIIGKVFISLNVSTTAPLANWVVRLEDFNPMNNESVLITGSNFNGAQRESRTNPSYIPINESFIIEFTLFLTTWRFPIGHQIRIAITNSMYSMLWPSKYKMTTSLFVNDIHTFIVLPVSYISSGMNEENVYGKPMFLNDEIQVQYPPNACEYDNYYGTGDGVIANVTFDSNNDTMYAQTINNGFYCDYNNKHNQCKFWEYIFDANENKPEINTLTSFVRSYYMFNQSMPDIVIDGFYPLCDVDVDTVPSFPETPFDAVNNSIDLWTRMEIISDFNNFYIFVNRTIYQNGLFIQTKIFNQTIPRSFQ